MSFFTILRLQICLFTIVVSNNCYDIITTNSYGGSPGYNSINATNEGKITGLISWGIRNKTDNYLNTFGNFQWQSTAQKVSPRFGNDYRYNYKSCKPFDISKDDYINGYRILYDTYIHGLYFYTNNNHSYECIANDSLYYDSQPVIYNGYYMSGFHVKSGWAVDQIAFQFTNINCSYQVNTPANSAIAECNRTIKTETYGHRGGTDSEQFLNQGTINGIYSWGLDNEPFWNYKGIAQLNWSHTKGNIPPYVIGGHRVKPCSPFMLDENDYINGYRVIYHTYVHGIVFLTKYGKSYSCSWHLSQLDEYYDSNNISYDAYLSGFYIRYGGVIDQIAFQFTTFCSNMTINEIHKKKTQNFSQIIVGVAVGLVLFVLISIIWIKCKKRRTYDAVSKTDEEIDIITPTSAISAISPACNRRVKCIQNGLCVIITIGDYETYRNKQKLEINFNEGLKNIPVEKDLESLNKLFNLLNYKILPKDMHSCWEQHKLIKFLKEDIYAEMINDRNELKYDGLIVCVSSHGIEKHIITSDYKAIHKSFIHRVLSTTYPKLRDIPRIFIYDSCEGCNQFEEQKTDELKENSKYIGINDIPSEKTWSRKTDKNPDYQLAEIYASNIGFVAKYNEDQGSYFIHEFTKQMIRNIMDSKDVYLGRIFEKIQNDLHKQRKQQPTNIFFNDTRYIRLKVNH